MKKEELLKNLSDSEKNHKFIKDKINKIFHYIHYYAQNIKLSDTISKHSWKHSNELPDFFEQLHNFAWLQYKYQGFRFDGDSITFHGYHTYSWGEGETNVTLNINLDEFLNEDSGKIAKKEIDKMLQQYNKFDKEEDEKEKSGE